MQVKQHKDVTAAAMPHDLKRMYETNDIVSIRNRVHELMVHVHEDQSEDEFHASAARLFVAIGLYDSLQSGGTTTLMSDYLNV
jgi:HD superfamily phosphohydrolase YqeK